MIPPQQRWCCQVCGGTLCPGRSGSVSKASGSAHSWRFLSPQCWSQNGGCRAGSGLWPSPSWPPDPPPGSDTRWEWNCSLCSETRTGGEKQKQQWCNKRSVIMCLMFIHAYLFDIAEFTLGAICLWDNPPPSAQWTLAILSSTLTWFSPLPKTPPLPWRESIRRTESDPHLWLLDHVQVLTRNPDDSASTVKEKQ